MVALVSQTSEWIIDAQERGSYFLCMNAMNEDKLNHYFDLLEETMKENKLLNSPTKKYNVDETGVPLVPKTPKVITVKAAMQLGMFYHH